MERPAKSSLSTGQEAAEAIAVAALSYLAANSEHLDRFFAITGLSAHSLRAAAQGPEFYAAVLDYFMADERSLLAFAQSAGVRPEAIVRAREALSGPLPPAEP